MNDQLRRRSVGPPAARSMLLTVLGEYVLPLADGVWQDALIKALTTLDYKPFAARQALARSVSGGWLRTERHGRRARMFLTDEARAMLSTGAGRIYSFGEPSTWDGQWLLILVHVPEEHRDVRHIIRSRLAWAGFGSLGGGLWITPHTDREAEVEHIAHELVSANLLSFRAQFGSMGEPAKVAAQAWDLDDVAERYSRFVTRFGTGSTASPKDAFRSRTELVHYWRRFPFLDPDLPAEVLPADWPRLQAYGVFRERYAACRRLADGYFGSLEDVAQRR